MTAPASRGSSAETGEARSEMAVTTRKATEKSPTVAWACPDETLEACSASAPTQMPKDSISCWNVV